VDVPWLCRLAIAGLFALKGVTAGCHHFLIANLGRSAKKCLYQMTIDRGPGIPIGSPSCNWFSIASPV